MAVDIVRGQVAKRQPAPRKAAQGIRTMVGFDPPPPGTYDTYRLMRSSPTLALALAAIKSPVKAAGWSYEADDDVPDDITQFVRKTMERHKRTIVSESLRMIEYGFQTFERVWGVDADDPLRTTYVKVKPLLPDITTAMVDDYGNLVGLDNKGVQIGVRKLAWVTWDKEGDDYYGRSLLENARKVWWAWDQTLDRIGAYIRKNAGVIPWVKFPPGTSPGRDGAVVDNWLLGEQLLDALASGNGVLMPHMFADYVADAVTDLVAKGINPDVFAAWQVGFYESRAGAGAEMLSDLQHFESLQVRAMLRPERSLLEGTHGTLAEAEVQTDTGLGVSEELSEQIAHEASVQFIDDLLDVNFGRQFRGKVRAKAVPLADDDKAFFRDVTKLVLTNPSNLSVLTTVTDIDSMLDKAAWPKRAEVIDNSAIDGGGDVGPTPPAPGPPAPDPANPGLPPAARALARAVEAARLMAAAAAG